VRPNVTTHPGNHVPASPKHAPGNDQQDRAPPRGEKHQPPRGPFCVFTVTDEVDDADPAADDEPPGDAAVCELVQAVANRAAAAIGAATRSNTFLDERACMMISFYAGSRSDAFRVNGFRGSIRRSGRNGSAVPDVRSVTPSEAFRAEPRSGV